MASAELPGLLVSTPLGFMAATGLLRVLSEDCGLSVALGWRESTAFIDGVTYEEISEALSEHMIDRSNAPEFNFSVSSEPAKVETVSHLREISVPAFVDAVIALKANHRALGFLAAMASDTVIDTNKGYCRRTSFDFSSGQQKIVVQWRELAKLLDPLCGSSGGKLVDRINSALLGGPFEEQHSFGWEPANVRSHATHTMAPTHDKPAGHTMKLWLGVECLPLHPICPIDSGRCHTIGFSGNSAYIWPRWKDALSYPEVKLLRARPVQTLNEVAGVDAVYRYWPPANTDFFKQLREPKVVPEST